MRKMIKIFGILILLIISIIAIINSFLNNKNISVIEKDKIISKNNNIECTVFDGREIKGTATISIENGKLSNEIIFNPKGITDSKFFLMPGLIDAHTHITNEKQIEQMIKNGVTTTYDVAASKEIANKNIAVIPTLVMMKAFANSKIYGFEETDYQDAEKAVKLLNSYGVPILVGTDANSSFFVPDVNYGSSLHKEMELLVKAGLTPLEVLQGATTKTVEAFGIEENSEKQQYKSIMVLIEGQPDKT